MDEATILHADVDSFFASVEQRDDPALRGRPVIVGAGVVLAASYEAKAYGVRTAMGGRQARSLCPQAIVVSPRMSAYSDASKAMFRVFEDATPLVEGLSIDEAFLDVRGMRRLVGTPTEIAVRLRRDVREKVGLPITVGVARTKFLAKVASGVAKPDGLLVVPPDDELGFLHPLPVERLWGVGPVTAAKLRSRGFMTVGQVAGLAETALVSMLGPAAGRQLHALAHNRDRRRVQPGRRRGSIGSQRALGRSPRSHAEIDATLVALVDRVTGRMRRAGRTGRTVVLRLRFDDFTRATRSHTLPRATAETHVILTTARGLLAAETPTIERRGLTLVGIAVANLESDRGVQLVLPFATAGGLALDTVVDEIRARFGTGAITRAVLLGLERSFEMPLTPGLAPVVEHEGVRAVGPLGVRPVHGDALPESPVASLREHPRRALAREADADLETGRATAGGEPIAGVQQGREQRRVSLPGTHGRELHVARVLDRLRPLPSVADGEAGDVVSVAHEHGVSDSPTDDGVDLARQVETGVDRVGDRTARLERLGSTLVPERCDRLHGCAGACNRLLGESRQEPGPEAVLAIEVHVLRALREGEEPGLRHAPAVDHRKGTRPRGASRCLAPIRRGGP